MVTTIEGLKDGVEYTLMKIDRLLSEQSERPLIVHIGGPSASGKSTYGRWVRESLQRKKVGTTYIEGDGFYKPNSIELATTRYGTPDSPNFDHRETYDFQAAREFLENLSRKKKGRLVVPNLPWLREQKGFSHGTTLRDVVIFEGLFSLDQELLEHAGLKIGVDSDSTLQFLNRLVRDPERGMSYEAIIKMFPTVHEMYKTFIKPTFSVADFVVRNPYHPIQQGHAGKPTYQKKVVGRFPDLEARLSAYPTRTLIQRDIYYEVPGGSAGELVVAREEETEKGVGREIKFKWGVGTANRQEFSAKLPPINVYAVLDNANFRRVERLEGGITKERKEFEVNGGKVRIDKIKVIGLQQIDAVEFSGKSEISVDRLAALCGINPPSLTDITYKSLVLGMLGKKE
ncbi:MAG TPA: hypothetical protein VI933_00075 [archaeon]|nr:hypothetical protein [archaeon]